MTTRLKQINGYLGDTDGVIGGAAGNNLYTKAWNLQTYTGAVDLTTDFKTIDEDFGDTVAIGGMAGDKLATRSGTLQTYVGGDDLTVGLDAINTNLGTTYGIAMGAADTDPLATKVENILKYTAGDPMPASTTMTSGLIATTGYLGSTGAVTKRAKDVRDALGGTDGNAYDHIKTPGTGIDALIGDTSPLTAAVDNLSGDPIKTELGTILDFLKGKITAGGGTGGNYADISAALAAGNWTWTSS